MLGPIKARIACRMRLGMVGAVHWDRPYGLTEQISIVDAMESWWRENAGRNFIFLFFLRSPVCRRTVLISLPHTWRAGAMTTPPPWFDYGHCTGEWRLLNEYLW